jgi:antitoxin component of MazEF toxin-antitoxin module
MASKDNIKIFRLGGSTAIYVPALIKSDSTFPFEIDEPLVMEIKGESLVIRRLTKDELKN